MITADLRDTNAMHANGLASNSKRGAPRLLAQLELDDDISNDHAYQIEAIGAVTIEECLTRSDDTRPCCEQHVDVVGLRWLAGRVAQLSQPRVDRERHFGAWRNALESSAMIFAA